jgi:hypothetical protein
MWSIPLFDISLNKKPRQPQPTGKPKTHEKITSGANILLFLLNDTRNVITTVKKG